jgi:hypothetical protein
MSELPVLNLPSFKPKLSYDSDSRQVIWDVIRKKNIVLTPEEWVRQHIIHALICEGYPSSLIAVEKGIKIGYNQEKRFDLVVYSSTHTPFLAIECKAPEVKVTQKAFTQLFEYNTEIRAPYLMVSNGLNTLILDCTKATPSWLHEIPKYR